MVRTVNDKELEKAVDEMKGYLVVYFFWHGNVPCGHFDPEFDALAELLEKRASFLKLDADENPTLTALFGVEAVPATVVFKDGKRLAMYEGPYSKDALKERISDLMASTKRKGA